MKKLSLLLFSFLLFGCAHATTQITTVYQLNNPIYKVGGSEQTESYAAAKKRFLYAKMVPYSSVEELFPALQTEKIDAAVFDRPSLEHAASLYKEAFVVLPESLADGHVAIAKICIHHVGKGRIPFALSVNHHAEQAAAPLILIAVEHLQGKEVVGR